MDLNGYSIRYENPASPDEKARCLNGGVIILYQAPKTGDIRTTGFWGLLLLLSSIGFVYLLSQKNRIKRTK